jgi:hypothetical protein
MVLVGKWTSAQVTSISDFGARNRASRSCTIRECIVPEGITTTELIADAPLLVEI